MSCCGHPSTCEKPCFHGGAVYGDEYLIKGNSFPGAITRSLNEFPVVLKNPKITWTTPEPRKLTLDEQCEAAMARLKAHIDADCALHREAIRANSNWDIQRMHKRHDGYAPAISALGWTMYRNGDMLICNIRISNDGFAWGECK